MASLKFCPQSLENQQVYVRDVLQSALVIYIIHKFVPIVFALFHYAYSILV
ncbi:hypothetical protein [Wolbachia endosymbiont (group A) of Volucella inflata]|uniref:hypothetical protein n=1 Tax=Wolbachia endosymbiont (group A) of Volucella inflata TaxID=2954065 RepID=UPI002226D83C|nr:hypothetical protein [Wolbachia endosymbiont (group A) of Volucella inflata]